MVVYFHLKVGELEILKQLTIQKTQLRFFVDLEDTSNIECLRFVIVYCRYVARKIDVFSKLKEVIKLVLFLRGIALWSSRVVNYLITAAKHLLSLLS